MILIVKWCTGLISRRGEGRFFDINKRADLAEYIDNYSIIKNYNSEKYFEYQVKMLFFLIIRRNFQKQ